MDWRSAYTTVALRPDSSRKSTTKTVAAPLADESPGPDAEEIWIACRNCHQRLTRPSRAIAVNGSHQHTFANPGGVVFEIGCYQWATGCSLYGSPSSDFTWFAGYFWQIATCSACQSHLGWLFRSQDGGQFYGLILDRLTELSGTS